MYEWPTVELAADHRDQVAEVGAMRHERHQRAVLVVDRLPVGAVHRRVVEILALDPPRLAEDLRPLGTRIDQRIEAGDIDRRLRPPWPDDR